MKLLAVRRRHPRHFFVTPKEWFMTRCVCQFENLHLDGKLNRPRQQAWHGQESERCILFMKPFVSVLLRTFQNFLHGTYEPCQLWKESLCWAWPAQENSSLFIKEAWSMMLDELAFAMKSKSSSEHALLIVTHAVHGKRHLLGELQSDCSFSSHKYSSFHCLNDWSERINFFLSRESFEGQMFELQDISCVHWLWRMPQNLRSYYDWTP